MVVGTDLLCHSLKMCLMSYSAPAKPALSVVSAILISYLSYFLSADLEGCSQLLSCIGGKPVLPMEIQSPRKQKHVVVLSGFVSSKYTAIL